MPAFTRRTGHSHYKTYPSSGTIAAGDPVQFDENGEVAVGASAKSVVGVAVNAATSSTNCTVDIDLPGDTWWAAIGTGTMAEAEVGEEADIHGTPASGLTLTESNNDFLITGWDGVTTTKCFGQFMKSGSTTIAA